MRAVRLMRSASFADSVEVDLDLPSLTVAGMHPVCAQVIDSDGARFEMYVYPHGGSGKCRTYKGGDIGLTVTLRVRDVIDGLAIVDIVGTMEDLTDGTELHTHGRTADDADGGITSAVRAEIRDLIRLFDFYVGCEPIGANDL